MASSVTWTLTAVIMMTSLAGRSCARRSDGAEPPSIRVQPQRERAYKSQDVVLLECDASGRPAPTTLKALWSYLHERGIDTVSLWVEIKDLIVKTVLSSEAAINSAVKANTKSRYCCHELFGFDILLDDKLKPWVLEVNISPSLHSKSQLDIKVKGGMIRDLFNIAGYMLPDKDDVVTNPVSSPDIRRKPSSSTCMDRRLWPTQKSADERSKHAFFLQKHTDIESILNILTPDDIRILIEFIGEDSRRGNFERVFPTTTSRNYHRYFEQPRYYNLLLDVWCRKFARNEVKGVSLLRNLCAKGVHLQHPAVDPQHLWGTSSGGSGTSRDSKTNGLLVI